MPIDIAGPAIFKRMATTIVPVYSFHDRPERWGRGLIAKHIPKVGHMARCLGTAGVLCVTLADAAADASSVVVNRQRDMKEIAMAVKTIAAMFKAPDTYSSATFGQAATTVSERAGQ